jgi:signal transduction histidine kinase
VKALLGLRAQVALLVLAVTACLFSLLGAVGFLQIAHSGRDAIHQRVATVVDILAAQLRAGTHTVRLATPDGVVATVIGATPPTDIPAGHEITVQRTITISGTTIRLEGQASDVALADSLHSLHTALWIGIPIAAILSAVLAGYAAHRALRPVAGITRQVEQIGPTDTTSRVPVPATGDEIDHLAGTVNSMLDRIAAGRLTQQRFTSDAAHELRTPLMALQGEIELARAHTISTDDAFLARTETLTSRLASRVDDLILLSTLDEAPPLTRAPTNVTELVHTEAAAMPKPIDVIGGPDISADIDHNLIARAVRNLLVNACRHAQHVTATVINEDDAVIIRIDDDGPGIDPTQRERIFQRFARTDDARDTETGGAGLGLAIVSSIANAHHGHTTITTSPHGGARFTLTLPRDQNAPSPQNS